jgi:hypothetical protein
MTPKQLDDMAKATRDPETLSDSIFSRMKAARVGPFAHDFSELIAKLHGQSPRAQGQDQETNAITGAASRTDKADPRGA